jgi:hypothetical protein
MVNLLTNFRQSAVSYHYTPHCPTVQAMTWRSAQRVTCYSQS